MKNYIKILGFSIIFLLSSIQWVFAWEIWVSEIQVISPTTLEVQFSENPNLRVGEIEAEIKVLRDISVIGGFVQDSQKVEIVLDDAILPQTAYSLLTIIWAEGSIDFVSPNELEGTIIQNISSMEEEDIESIEIIDSRNIIVTYKQDITELDFEYKLLAESNIEKIENLDYYDSKLEITVAPPFASEQDYILMFIDLQDVDWNYVEFDTGIYDFTTPDIHELERSEGEENIDQESIWIDENIGDSELEVIQVNRDNSEDNLGVDTLNAAGSEISWGTSVNTVAGNAIETPDTWAETWVLIFASLFINTIYYLSRRKKLCFA